MMDDPYAPIKTPAIGLPALSSDASAIELTRDEGKAMTIRKNVVVPAAMAGLILVGAGTAWAAGGSDESREAQAGASMAVSLTEAIATAEQQTGGKAYDAGIDIDHGKSRIVVETSGPKGVQTVMVDGTSGKIVGQHQGGEQD